MYPSDLTMRCFLIGSPLFGQAGRFFLVGKRKSSSFKLGSSRMNWARRSFSNLDLSRSCLFEGLDNEKESETELGVSNSASSSPSPI